MSLNYKHIISMTLLAANLWSCAARQNIKSRSSQRTCPSDFGQINLPQDVIGEIKWSFQDRLSQETRSFWSRFKMNDAGEMFMEVQQLGFSFLQIMIDKQKAIVLSPQQNRYWQGEIGVLTAFFWGTSMQREDLWNVMLSPRDWADENQDRQLSISPSCKKMNAEFFDEAGARIKIHWEYRSNQARDNMPTPKTIRIAYPNGELSWTYQSLSFQKLYRTLFFPAIPKAMKRVADLNALSEIVEEQ